MKIVMIAGDGGSGGLVGYIQGLISANSMPENFKIVLFCGYSLFDKLKEQKTSASLIPTELALEKGKDVALDRQLPKELIKRIDSETPDVIFFMNGYVRKGLEKYPNVMVLHNQLFIDDYEFFRMGFNINTLKLFAFRISVRRSMKRADGVIFLSEFSKKQTDGKRIKYKNGAVIPFGFESENRIKKITPKRFLEKIRIIYISAMFPYKNHENVVKACSLLNKKGYETELLLVGRQNNPVFKNIQHIAKINKMMENVFYYDWVEHGKIREMIDEADIFIYASSIETTGYGLLEGMARGALIASSDRSGFADMLKDGGCYFNPENVYSIENCLENLIKMDEEDKFKMRVKALKYSENYSWESAASEHCKYFSKISGDKNA